MWEAFQTFFGLQEPGIRVVVMGTVLLSVSTSLVGCFTLLRKRALTGDAVAHAVLPGICIAFLWTASRNPIVLLVGAFLSGWGSLLLMDLITQKTRIKEDAAIAIILSSFFGIGILILTYMQHIPGLEGKAGINNYLFGSAISLNQEDVMTFGVVALLLITCILVFFRPLQLIAFDEVFARSIGVPVGRYQMLLTTMTVFAVVIGIQTVGIVLMAAMLITPAATARFFTNKLRKMLLIAAVVGAISSLIGAFLSYAVQFSPQSKEGYLPTGPSIVMVLSGVAILSFLFSPKKGVFIRLRRQIAFKNKILEENILKALYHLGEKDNAFTKERSLSEILNQRSMDSAQLEKGIRRLLRDGYAKKNQEKLRLTDRGMHHGKRITRLHRLWELYLTEYVRIAPDHVHDDAETIEHILTPEIETKLEEILKNPTLDPHQSKIPN
jgi:manganese/zinc/iron transport system permease protein